MRAVVYNDGAGLKKDIIYLLVFVIRKQILLIVSSFTYKYGCDLFCSQ